MKSALMGKSSFWLLISRERLISSVLPDLIKNAVSSAGKTIFCGVPAMYAAQRRKFAYSTKYRPFLLLFGVCAWDENGAIVGVSSNEYTAQHICMDPGAALASGYVKQSAKDL
jgi:hypothetical protein